MYSSKKDGGSYRDFCCPWNRNDVFALGEKPGESDLTTCCFVFLADISQFGDESEDVWEVFLGVAASAYK